jgi:uncharacterized protein YcbK (DUF882 family)
MNSAHFSDRELACPHCGVNGVHQELVDALEAFRAVVCKPVIVNSAYRCPEHNAAVGGAPSSQHILGLAADIQVTGMTAAELEAVARTIPAIKGIGRSTPPQTYIHIDVRETPAEWTYDVNGKQAPYYPAA